MLLYVKHLYGFFQSFCRIEWTLSLFLASTLQKLNQLKLLKCLLLPIPINPGHSHLKKKKIFL